MIRTLAWLALLALGVTIALLSGCASFDHSPREYRKPTIMVSWVETDDIVKACGQKALACADISQEYICTIFTSPYPSLEILGHEALHCFTGRFH